MKFSFLIAIVIFAYGNIHAQLISGESKKTDETYVLFSTATGGKIILNGMITEEVHYLTPVIIIKYEAYEDNGVNSCEVTVTGKIPEHFKYGLIKTKVPEQIINETYTIGFTAENDRKTMFRGVSPIVLDFDRIVGLTAEITAIEPCKRMEVGNGKLLKETKPATNTTKKKGLL